MSLTLFIFLVICVVFLAKNKKEAPYLRSFLSGINSTMYIANPNATIIYIIIFVYLPFIRRVVKNAKKNILLAGLTSLPAFQLL